MWYSGTWFSGAFDTPGLMVGLDHKDLFQPKWFYYCIKIGIKHYCYIVFPSKQMTSKIFSA